MYSLALVWAQVVNYILTLPISFLIIRLAAPRELSLIVASQAIASISVVFTNADFDYENLPRSASSGSFGQHASFGIRSKAFAIWAGITIIFCPVMFAMAKDLRELSIVLLCYLGSFGAVLLQNSLIFYFSMQNRFFFVATALRIAFLCAFLSAYGRNSVALVYSALVAFSQILPGILVYILELRRRPIRISNVRAGIVGFAMSMADSIALCRYTLSGKCFWPMIRGLFARLLSINVVWQLALASPGVILPLAIESQAGFSQLVLFDRISRPTYQVSNMFAYSLFKSKGLSRLQRMLLAKKLTINRAFALAVLALAACACYKLLFVLACLLVPSYAAAGQFSTILLFCSLLLIVASSFGVNYSLLGVDRDMSARRQAERLVFVICVICFGLYAWVITSVVPAQTAPFISSYLMFCAALPILSLLARRVLC